MIKSHLRLRRMRKINLAFKLKRYMDCCQIQAIKIQRAVLSLRYQNQFQNDKIAVGVCFLEINANIWYSPIRFSMIMFVGRKNGKPTKVIQTDIGKVQNEDLSPRPLAGEKVRGIVRIWPQPRPKP